MKHRVLFSLLIILSSYATAQQCTTSVLVNAFDAKTKTSLRGMRASDFSANSGRDPLSVESVRPVFRNRVLVLLDLSGQDSGSQRATVLQNIVDYINGAPQGMPVAFGVFAEHAVFTNGFSSDPESLASSLHSTAQRATALGEHSHLAGALRQALAIFGQHRPGDTILLVGNGDGRTSRAQGNSLAREFSRRNVRLQLLMNTPAISGLNGSSFLSAFEMADHINPTLIKLANRTGGVLMGFMNSEWYNVAASGYLLDIRESQRTKPKNWRLRVRNYDDEFGVTPVLFYPRQLPACSASLLASADVN